VAANSSAKQVIRDATDLVSSVAPGCRRTMTAHRESAQATRALRDRHTRARAAHRRALFEVKEEGTYLATRQMDFQIPKIVHEEVDEHRGIFQIEPLDRGFGYTLATRCARAALVARGAAVTSVKIEGIAHEFTTLQGVREDVTTSSSTSRT